MTGVCGVTVVVPSVVVLLLVVDGLLVVGGTWHRTVTSRSILEPIDVLHRANSR